MKKATKKRAAPKVPHAADLVSGDLVFEVESRELSTSANVETAGLHFGPGR